MKRHWSPRYIYNRLKNYFFEKKNQDLPWLTPDSIILLDDLIKKKDIGIEFGSGRSTAWFAIRCKFLTSVEDNLQWYEIVKEKLKYNQIDNVDYFYKNCRSVNGLESEYYKIIEEFRDDSLDFVLIDGKHRDILSLIAIQKIKLGGLLILDNANRYLPFETYSPHSINNNLNKVTKEWVLFNKKIESWRKIGTSNGVTDTVIYIKTV
jgi:predicted O-methyltransferase YrrM